MAYGKKEAPQKKSTLINDGTSFADWDNKNAYKLKQNVIISGKGGTAPGGWITDNAAGTKHMAKICSHPLEGVTEVLGNLFYGHHPRVNVPEVNIGVFDQNLGQAIVRPFISTANPGMDASEVNEITTFFLGPKLKVPNNPKPCCMGVLSEAVIGYHDVGRDFVESITQSGRFPQTINYNNKNIPIQGLAEAAALSKVIGDPDWMGGDGANIGFVVKQAEDGSEYAQVVVVDPGQAFLRLNDKNDTKDIGLYAMDTNKSVKFEKLLPEHQRNFLETIQRLADMSDSQLREIFTKGGKLENDLSSLSEIKNPDNNEAVLPNDFIENLVKSVRQSINNQVAIYKNELLILKAPEILDVNKEEQDKQEAKTQINQLAENQQQAKQQEELLKNQAQIQQIINDANNVISLAIQEIKSLADSAANQNLIGENGKQKTVLFQQIDGISNNQQINEALETTSYASIDNLTKAVEDAKNRLIN